MTYQKKILSIPKGGKGSVLTHASMVSAIALFSAMSHASEDNQGNTGGASLVLEEVIVSGSALANRKAMDIKANSDQVMDSLASDDLGSLPDLNVADSFRRIPGINTINQTDEGQYVTTRGLDGSLNIVTIDGMTMASDNRDTRRVNMESIPPTAVSGLDVYKTFTPNLDGNAIGGQLNMRTRSAYDKNGRFLKTDFSLSKYTHDEVPDNDDKVGGTFGLGYSDTFGEYDQFGVVVDVNYALKNRDETRSANSYRWVTDSNENDLTPLYGKFQSKLYTTEWERMGGSVKLEFNPSEKLYTYVSGLYYTGDQEETQNNFALETRNGDDYISLTPTNGEVETGRASQQYSEFVTERELKGLHFHTTYEIDDLQRLRFDVSSSTAIFDHDKREIKWKTSDEAALGYSYDTNGGSQPTWAVNDPSYITNAGNYNHDELKFEHPRQEETVEEIQIDYGFNSFSGAMGWGVDVGLKYRKTDRTWELSRLYWKDSDLTMSGFLRDENYTASNMTYPSFFLNGDAFLDYYNENIDDFTFDDAKSAEHSMRDNFHYIEEVTAAYSALRYANDDLLVIAGVRYEATDYESSSFSLNKNDKTFDPVKNGSDYSNVLPSINLTYSISDNLKLRAALSKSLGRADASTVSAKQSVDVDGNETKISRGNPDLKPRKSDNYDLSLEYYFEDGDGMLSAALFNKEIEDLVLKTSIETINGNDVLVESTYQNSDNARVSGLELSYIQNSFDFLPEPFDRLGFSGNVTIIDAQMTYLNSDSEKVTVDHLLNQSDFMLNMALFYAFDFGEFRLAYNRTDGFSRGLRINSSDQYKETYWDDYYQVDAQFRFDVNDNLTLIAKARNLTDEHRTIVTGVDQELSGEQINFGPSYWVGASYKF